jgi:hypothetical protein
MIFVKTNKPDLLFCIYSYRKVFALNVVGKIPEELQDLTYLTYLNLDQNYLTGYLPTFIGNMTYLRELYVAFNALSGVLPRELWNLKNLISLSLSMTKFVGVLPDEIQYLTELERLLCLVSSCLTFSSNNMHVHHN